MAFDTLTYAKKLQQAGVPPEQAELHAEALRTIVEGNLASKQDLDLLRQALKYDIEQLRQELKHDIEQLRQELKHDIEQLRNDMELMRRDLLIKLGGLAVAGFTVLAALIGIVIAMVQMG